MAEPAESTQNNDMFGLLQSQLAVEREQNEVLKKLLDTLCSTEWRYSHSEIEAACGGDIALQVRRAVIERRIKILQALSQLSRVYPARSVGRLFGSSSLFLWLQCGE